MANKIVQLVDANDDNIFPLSNDPSAAHITMTTTDPGEGSPLDQNEFIGVYGGDPIIMDYSTSEVNTGAKWIDGSDIYKKTVDFGAAPNATTKSVAHNISNLDKVIKFEGYGYSSGSGRYTPIPYAPASANSLMDMHVDATNITFTSNNDRSSWSFVITLYYTKSS